MKKVINTREIELVTNPETLKLYNHEVLTREEDQRVRRVNLDKANTLGNANRTTHLILDTPSGYKKITAKVIGVDENNVWLEDRTLIPIKSIYAVDIA